MRRHSNQLRIFVTALLCALVTLSAVATEQSEAAQFGRRFHVWGRFRPGSWAVVRQRMETVDGDGRVVFNSTCETRTTLSAADDQALTLKVQASLEMGGKKLDSPAQEVRQGINGEQTEAVANFVELGDEDVVVQGQTYRCQVRQTEAVNGERKHVTKTWFSQDVAPYVLRRTTTTIDTVTGGKVGETLMEVVSLTTSRRILARNRPVAEVRIVQQHPRGQTTSVAWNCPEVPGGIVSQTSEEFDTAGKLVRRTKMELVDFETK